MSFTRGGWRPYCTAEVRALNDVYDELKFNLLVDRNNEVGKAFGIVYAFPEDLKNVYSNLFKNDIQAVNNASDWQLPLPARFIIDMSGTIRDVKADPDYRYRPDPSEALAVVKSLGLRNS